MRERLDFNSSRRRRTEGEKGQITPLVGPVRSFVGCETGRSGEREKEGPFKVNFFLPLSLSLSLLFFWGETSYSSNSCRLTLSPGVLLTPQTKEGRTLRRNCRPFSYSSPPPRMDGSSTERRRRPILSLDSAAIARRDAVLRYSRLISSLASSPPLRPVSTRT